MKNSITTLILCLLTINLSAQSKIFAHKATPANSVADYTLIDHPALNGNPAAKFIVSHVFNTTGQASAGIYNNQVSGVRYNTAASKWTIYNESEAALVAGSSYFVYIPNANNAFYHIATEDNIFISVTRLNIPSMTGNTSAIAVATNSYLAKRNPSNTSLGYLSWIGTSNPGWNLYLEPGPIEAGVSFFVATEGDSGIVAVKHTSATANIANYVTVLNHPLLNGNPNAKFVFSRNREVVGQGSDSGVYFPKTFGAMFFLNRWCIFTEDQSPMLPNLTFSLMIQDPALAVEELAAAKIGAYPNPVTDKAFINTKDAILDLSVYNATGQMLKNTAINLEEKSIDMSAFHSGIYWVKVQTEKGWSTLKLIKD